MGRLFGTDGVRGIANRELTCERALSIGRAAAQIICGNKENERHTILIGRDTRLSSTMLATALASGITSVGADVVFLGVVPTPAVAYLVRKWNASAGIMISASHNPAEFNGIKIFSASGFKLPDALEEAIESIVLDNTPPCIPCEPNSIGNIYLELDRAKNEYIEYIKSTVDCKLDGLNIAIDCSNGSSSATAEEIFTSLGAKVHMLHYRPDGLNINRNCGSTHMESLRDYVISHKLDAGLAFDGDADRFLCVDNRGNIIDGDMIMAILAVDMKERGMLAKDTVVGTIMTNFGFTKFCEANGFNFIPTKVGDRYVLEQMNLEGLDLGGEQSGHIIIRKYATTGDGQLTAVQLLATVIRSGKTLSELATVMTRYPQSMVNIKVSPQGKLALYTDDKVTAVLDRAKNALGSTGRLVVRPSGTEPLVRIMAEGMDEAMINRLVTDTAKEVEKLLANY